jgi:hypothetical protein
MGFAPPNPTYELIASRPPMKYDTYQLERAAARLVSQERYREALKIYFFMSDGDASLDAG